MQPCGMTCSITDDDKEHAISADQRPKAPALSALKRRNPNDVFRALGHFPGTTLTERVVEFLEKYNESVYGFA